MQFQPNHLISECSICCFCSFNFTGCILCGCQFYWSRSFII